MSHLTLDDGSTIAYHKFTPEKTGNLAPNLGGIVFMGGFMSDMQGSKALYLENFCKHYDVPYVRFDYFGHGDSSGEFLGGTIGRWKHDTLEVIDQLTEGPQLLVGSSMGGWLMLLAALARPNRVAGLVGIAAGPDFTDDLIWDKMTDAQRDELKKNGQFIVPCNTPPSADFEPDPYPISLKLIEEARSHMLLHQREIAIDCPVRLIHGMLDEDVPYQLAERICEKLTSKDVMVHLLKHGDHRLSAPRHLHFLGQVIKEMLHSLGGQE